MDRNIKDSQNFLHNTQLVNKLVRMSNLTSEDLVYEIGPGKGIITRALLGHCKKIVAIEYDAELYKQLKDQFGMQKEVMLLNKDFLTVDLPTEPYKIFSNIPFNLTADILSKVLTTGRSPEDMYLVMQYEAALKYSGEPYYQESFKSLLFKPSYNIEIMHHFEKTDFVPSPNVSIVFVHFHKKEYCDIKKVPLIDYWDFLAFVYSAPGQFFKEKTKKIFSYEQQKRLRKQLEIKEDALISKWTYKQWLGLFDFYSKTVSPEKKQAVIGAYNRLITEQSKLDKLHRNRKTS